MVMAENSSKVYVDPLFVGLTRPPMLFGVSYTFFIVNAFVCLLGFILYNDFRILFSLGPVHFVGYYLCSKEPLFIELFMLKSSKCNKARKNLTHHGGNSYDPY